jgi:membrane protease subunit (stomatin/prohibitin family)
MYRRQGFRQDLVDEQCAELVSLEDRLQELDSLLAVAASARRAAPSARCECGAPILWGSHFCANCGRPHGERPVVACASCGAAIPAEAKFCASCGKPVATAES